MPAVSYYVPTGDAYIDGMLSGVKWATAALTFSFPSDSDFYESPYPNDEPLTNFEAFTTIQQSAVRAVLQMYASVAIITFSEVIETSTEHGDLRYAESDEADPAHAYYPNASPAGGDAWFNHSSNQFDNPGKGTYAYQGLLHETGHALGLKHPHDVKGSFGAMPLDRDSLEYSVMSYRSYVGQPTTEGYTPAATSFPQTLMMYDIAALQVLYGANYSTNSGNTTYRWNPTTGEMLINGVGQGAPAGNKVFMTLWDGGGQDTYDLWNYTTGVTVDLRPGYWTTTSSTQLANLGNGHFAAGNIANALLFGGSTASLIENIICGDGNDTLIGNLADNSLYGGDGTDTMIGGAGNDTYYANVASDVVMENSNEGNDTIVVSFSYYLASTLENIVLAPWVGAINCWGNDANNTITGNASNNLIYGGDGTDTMIGGAGDDTYYADIASDVVMEELNGGNDTIVVSFSGYFLAPTLENLALAPWVGSINCWGNDANNTITGNASDNLIYGGDGTDTMVGGAGDDTYYCDIASDVVTENPNGGNDTIVVSFSYYLTSTLENVVLAPWVGAINGWGNDANNTITGNASNNLIYGGDGADTMIGGAGDDTYYTDIASDVVTESINGGNDTIVVSYNYTLASNLENLTLAPWVGAINGWGNGVNNSITGNASNNLLYGGGGDDTMIGGLGADTLSGEAGADRFTYGAQADSSTNAMDIIADFLAGTDLFDIQAYGLSNHNVANVTVGAFQGGSAVTDFFVVSSVTNAVVVQHIGNQAQIYVDLDKDGSFAANSDLVIHLNGMTANITASEFVF